MFGDEVWCHFVSVASLFFEYALSFVIGGVVSEVFCSVSVGVGVEPL
mgnify:FL=1